MGAVTEISMTVDALRVHSAGGAWTNIAVTPTTFNLLSLNAAGAAQLLVEAKLAAGQYDQIELSVSKVAVADAQGQHEAKLPSNKLQLKGLIDVQPNATAAANMDFIAHQSLHVTGTGTYILAPVVHLDARASAEVQVQADKKVHISGGRTTASIQMGMDIEGSVDTGLRVSPDAVLSVAASGKVSQEKGQALLFAVIKSYDASTGAVTLTTKSGDELVLHMKPETSVNVRGSAAPASDLQASIGKEVMARFDAETKAADALAIEADAATKADVGAQLRLRGVIKSVDATAGKVTGVQTAVLTWS
jgi:hypothetical protein